MLVGNKRSHLLTLCGWLLVPCHVPCFISFVDVLSFRVKARQGQEIDDLVQSENPQDQTNVDAVHVPRSFGMPLFVFVVHVTPALGFVLYPMSAEFFYFLSMGQGRVFVCVVCFVAQKHKRIENRQRREEEEEEREDEREQTEPMASFF